MIDLNPDEIWACELHPPYSDWLYFGRLGLRAEGILTVSFKAYRRPHTHIDWRASEVFIERILTLCEMSPHDLKPYYPTLADDFGDTEMAYDHKGYVIRSGFGGGVILPEDAVLIEQEVYALCRYAREVVNDCFYFFTEAESRAKEFLSKKQWRARQKEQKKRQKKQK